jgi:hypothetical protein
MGKKSKQKQQRPSQTQAAKGTAPVAQAAFIPRAQGLEQGEQYIRGDIRRILMVLALMVVVLLVLVAVDRQSDALDQAGTQVARFFRLI